MRCFVRTESNLRFLPSSGIEVARGNIEAPETLDAALKTVDVIAHIAHIRYAPIIIAACERAAVRRVLFFSSTRRYTKYDCLTARQVCEGEAAIERCALDYTILRPSMIYGSRRDNNISRLIRAIQKSPVFPLIGGGKNLVQPVHTRDVVGALQSAIKTPAAIRSAYTIAGPRPILYREMIKTIARALQRRVLLVPVPVWPMLLAAGAYGRLTSRPRVTTEQIRRMREDRAFDISAAQADLDFRPIDFDEGVALQIKGDVDKIWDGEK